MTRIFALAANAYRRERWRNGGGWTREIMRQTAVGSDTWDWRLSIAEVEKTGDFSVFPLVDRALVLLEGAGMTMTSKVDDDLDALSVSAPGEMVFFPGERLLHAHLHAGPTRDYNVMWRRDRVSTTVQHVVLQETIELTLLPGERVTLFALSGTAYISTATLEAGDSALIEIDAEGNTAQVHGKGELIVARFAAILSV
jgi:uncharacterized protein